MAGGRIDIAVEPDVRGFPGKLQSGLKGALSVATTVGKGIGLAIAAGTLVAGAGLGAIIDKGNEYQGQLNELQAVTQATGLQMAAVGNIAQDLGSDLTLPATSAADAAAAMTELAKGGLSVEESMAAAKGTLRLAAAAQIDAAAAAEIQSDALNTFGLSADQAGRVADVLANTSNAASGSITDMAQALQQAGSVANQMGVPIEDVATALGLLANNGIKGSDAGTLLKTAFTQLSAPSGPARDAIRDLGLTVFDASGKFVGLRSIMEQLGTASKTMTQEQFAAATATVLGTDAVRLAGVAASSTTADWDAMAQAVSRVGGAQDVAAAKTRGLGGAIEGFQSQVETAGIGIYQAIAPSLERAVRAAADWVSDFTPTVVGGIESAVAAGEVFGPSLADAIRDRGDVVLDAVHDVLGPVAETVPDLLNAGVNAAIGLWNDVTDVLDNVVDAAKPVAQGIAAVARAAVEADGPVSAAGAALGIVGDVARVASGVLIPIGAIVGGIASAFAALPGPVQSALIALGLVAAFRGPLSSLGETVKSGVTAPFRAMGEEIRLQQALLTGSTDIMSAQVGKVGLAMAALESRVPVIGRIADSYRSGSAATEAFVRSQTAVVATSLAIQGASERTVGAVQGAGSALSTFSGVVGGATRAVGTGLRSAVTGLVGALGGPWGAVLAGAALGLSILASRQQEAAQKAADHRANVQSLADSLDRQTGAVTSSTRALALNQFAQGDVGDAVRRLGLDLQLVASAATGSAGAQESLGRALRDSARGALEQAGELENLQNIARILRVPVDSIIDAFLGNAQAMDAVSKAADKAGTSVGAIAANFSDHARSQIAVGEAVNATAADLDRQRGTLRDVSSSMLDSTSTGLELSKAMDVLRSSTASADDRARALKDALDALSGGQINLEAAQARLHEQLARLSEAFGSNVDKARGFGAALLNADGSINTTTENGRRLLSGLQDISGSMAEVAQRTFDTARAQGDDLPTALEKARSSAQATRQAFIAQHTQMGLTAQQAAALADRYGLLPDVVATAITTPGMTQAQQELVLVRQLVNQVPPGKAITVQSLSDEAKRKLVDLGLTVQTLPDGSVSVTANTVAAQNSLNHFIDRNQNRVIGVRVETRYVAGAGGRNLAGLAEGGILAAAYASGGVHRKLTPMRAGVAQMVPPNTWRIVGDRLRDDEAYIPINRSTTSVSLLAETARRMGFDLLRMYAHGGIAQSGRSALRDLEPRGVTVERLEIRALSDRFSLGQIQEELRWAGIR